MPLQLPGGPELLVIFLILVLVVVLYLGLPVFLAYLVYRYMDRKNSYDEQIRELEREVEALRSRVD
jgi:hypothetical protein